MSNSREGLPRELQGALPYPQFQIGSKVFRQIDGQWVKGLSGIKIVRGCKRPKADELRSYLASRKSTTPIPKPQWRYQICGSEEWIFESSLDHVPTNIRIPVGHDYVPKPDPLPAFDVGDEVFITTQRWVRDHQRLEITVPSILQTTYNVGVITSRSLLIAEIPGKVIKTRTVLGVELSRPATELRWFYQVDDKDSWMSETKLSLHMSRRQIGRLRSSRSMPAPPPPYEEMSDELPPPPYEPFAEVRHPQPM